MDIHSSEGPDTGIRPLQQLPPSTQSKIRSTQILTSLPQVISELVQNSLDAGASHIDVGVDCEDWACWVRDDGSGIGRDDFDALAANGGRAIRYSTSKAYSPASLDHVLTFGFRGEALASAADVSCLEISSRTARSRESWSVILKEGITLYHGSSLRWRRESPGTVVSVRDAFYNLPIRRRSHPSAVRTLELVRRDIETFALMFPNVTFSVENTHKTRSGTTGSGKVLIVPKTSSTVATFRHLYGRALVEHVDEIDEKMGDMRLEGFLSLDGSPSKAYQYLYINRHLMSPCDLHRIIESKFTRSSFAKHAYDEAGETTQPRSGTRRSPRKSEKKPVYVLNLTVPPRQVDNCLEPAKAAVHLQNSEDASTFLSSVIDAFLLRHGFLHPKMSRTRQEQGHADGSMAKKRKVVHSFSDPMPDTPEFAGTSRYIRVPNQRNTTTAPAPVIEPTKNRTLGSEEHTQEGLEVTWTDPATGEQFIVDTRTGNSYSIHSRLTEGGDEGPRGRRIIPMTDQATNTRKNMPDWIRNALETNESYPLLEPRIPAVSSSTTLVEEAVNWPTSSQPRHPLWRGSKRRARDCLSQPSYAQASQSHPSRFSKDDLSNVEVLGQVDKKFIACVFHTDTSTDVDEEPDSTSEAGKGKVLVLIDQHAADERVRVERFLQELCLEFLHHTVPTIADDPDGMRTRSLEPPIPVLLTQHEAHRLDNEGVREAFHRWGIVFSDNNFAGRAEGAVAAQPDEAGSRSGYVQAHVMSVPELLGDKLLAGDELRDLVKGYLAKLDAEGTPMLTPTPHAEPQDGADISSSSSVAGWQKAMRWCPRELHDLVNSKACRGAIMFNDTLTHEQCTRLVGQLARTVFPFQCAHGRPSLVPLTEIGRAPAQVARAGGAYSSSRAAAVDWTSFASEGSI